MSEENKWGQDPQDTGRTVLTEENALDTNGNADTGSAAETGTDNIDNKPLAHPYSAGRRIQENQRKSTDSSDTAVNNENGMDTPKYAHYQVHQPQAGNYAGGSIPPKKPRKTRTSNGNGGFGRKAATAVSLAVIFGLVAGVVFQGINMAADKLGVNSNSSSTQVEKTQTLTETEDSTDSSSSDSAVKNIVAESGTVAGVAQATMSSIVAITSVSVQEIPSFFGYGTRQYQSAGSGSGIIVGENDDELLIATNNHVVSGATTLTVCFAGSDVVGAEEETQAMASSSDSSFSGNTGSEGDADVENAVSAKIKGTDEENDLAVIAVEKSDIPEETMKEIKIAQLGSSDDLVVGEQVVAIGNALGYGQSVTTGVISALSREVQLEDESGNTVTSTLMQTDAAVNPGNSGGALLNMKGEVIGIVSAKYSDTKVEGMGYAIPISTAKDIIETIINQEVVSDDEASYFGISGVDVASDVSKQYDMPTGVYVTKVAANSAASKAGIQKGDIIVSFNGREVSSMDEISNVMQYLKAGTKVDVVVAQASNNYEEKTMEVTLTKKK